MRLRFGKFEFFTVIFIFDKKFEIKSVIGYRRSKALFFYDSSDLLRDFLLRRTVLPLLSTSRLKEITKEDFRNFFIEYVIHKFCLGPFSKSFVAS